MMLYTARNLMPLNDRHDDYTYYTQPRPTGIDQGGYERRVTLRQRIGSRLGALAYRLLGRPVF